MKYRTKQVDTHSELLDQGADNEQVANLLGGDINQSDRDNDPKDHLDEALDDEAAEDQEDDELEEEEEVDEAAEANRA